MMTHWKKNPRKIQDDNKIINRREELGDDLISQESFKQSLNSFLGMIDHCNGYELEKEIIWLSGLAEIKI